MLRDGRLQGWTLGPRVLRIRLSDLDAALSPYGGNSADIHQPGEHAGRGRVLADDRHAG